MPSFLKTALLVLPFLTGIVMGKDIENCPGIFYVGAKDSSACCVGATQPPIHSPLSCATLIPFTDPGYSSLVIEASKSLEASGTHYMTTIGKTPITGLGPIPTPSAGSTPTADAGPATTSFSGSNASPASATPTGAAAKLAAEIGVVGGALLAVAGVL
ncbi:hypothetical protein F5884DRAFT_830701 [Xylogone sp. PMI_703]|nr:hypothetical protein F5884DRAFT_830701 [Xylogone sp. PMI_703]